MRVSKKAFRIERDSAIRRISREIRGELGFPLVAVFEQLVFIVVKLFAGFG
jgi:hypothetical protein